MSSIVIELQKDALNKSVSATDLLRKAFVVARKLRLTEFQEWIEKELNGYEKDVPGYRVAHGEVRAWNPNRGWVPVYFKDPQRAELLSDRPNGQAIAELEDMLRRRGEDSSFYMPFSHSLQSKISTAIGFETQVALFCQRSSIVRVVDSVRNIVLNWALKLEEQGVLGEGLSFSEQEKSTAAKSSQSINNFYGPVHSAQISQGSSDVSQIAGNISFDKGAASQLIQQLRNAVQDLNFEKQKKEELTSELATVEAQVASPRPKYGIIEESLSSIRNILEGAGGGAAGQALFELGKLLLG